MSEPGGDKAGEKAPPEVIDAGLSLLDRQVIDCDGRLAGKVDDLELTVPEGGGAPVVTAVLAGPGALAHRLGGRLGAWVESVHARLHLGPEPEPARVPFDTVVEVGATVKLGVPKDDLELSRFEHWVRDHFIGHIPGADRAPD